MRDLSILKQTPLTDHTDDELNFEISHWYKELTGRGVDVATISALISEQAFRQMKKSSKHSFYISIFAISIALVALSFSLLDYFGDKKWQAEQIKALNEIKLEINRSTIK